MWEPWIGREYPSTKLLLLGESAFSWMEDDELVQPSPHHSKTIAEEAIRDFPTISFSNMLTRGLTGKEQPNENEREIGWSRIAFTNYVPSTVGNGPRIEPSAQQWQQAKSEFPKLLSMLAPQNIIVLGKRMWCKMPDAQIQLTEDVQQYRIGDGMLVTCWAVRHPSAGLSWSWLANLVRYILE